MKIKFSKDYSWAKMMHDYDRRRLSEHGNSCFRNFTTSSEYSFTWEDADVTQEQLEEYVNKGYAIRINC